VDGLEGLALSVLRRQASSLSEDREHPGRDHAIFREVEYGMQEMGGQAIFPGSVCPMTVVTANLALSSDMDLYFQCFCHNGERNHVWELVMAIAHGNE
jgi:hypothetical protein